MANKLSILEQVKVMVAVVGALPDAARSEMREKLEEQAAGALVALSLLSGADTFDRVVAQAK